MDFSVMNKSGEYCLTQERQKLGAGVRNGNAAFTDYMYDEEKPAKKASCQSKFERRMRRNAELQREIEAQQEAKKRRRARYARLAQESALRRKIMQQEADIKYYKSVIEREAALAAFYENKSMKKSHEI